MGEDRFAILSAGLATLLEFNNVLPYGPAHAYLHHINSVECLLARLQNDGAQVGKQIRNGVWAGQGRNGSAGCGGLFFGLLFHGLASFVFRRDTRLMSLYIRQTDIGTQKCRIVKAADNMEAFTA